MTCTLVAHMRITMRSGFQLDGTMWVAMALNAFLHCTDAA
jgi:hypothetical protein